MPIPFIATKMRLCSLGLCAAVASLASPASAVSSAELYTSESYPYGRFEARVQFAGADGVVGSFFLWKDGSEESGVFWNELDLETVWADCELLTNALYGDPEMVNSAPHGTDGNWCGSFHTYAYEWTPDYIAWFVDGVEIRRETGAHSTAFRDNAPDMQIHFNVWPGDSTFGGNFSPSSLPLHQYINWVQYYSYADGAFTLEWREDFGGDTLPDGWVTGDWDSPKGLSTHMPENVAFIDGYAVISMTADDALGSTGALPMDPEGPGPLVEPDDTTADDSAADDSSQPDDSAADDSSQPDDSAADDSAADDSGQPDDEVDMMDTSDEAEMESAEPGNDEVATDDGEGAPIDESGASGEQGAGGMSADDVPQAANGAGATPGDSPSASGAGTAAPTDATQQQPAGTQQDPAPVVTTSTSDSPSSATNVGASMPVGETGVPQPTGSSEPSTTAPEVMASAGESDGGCSASGPVTAGSHWPWLALMLGLCTGWRRRFTPRPVA